MDHDSSTPQVNDPDGPSSADGLGAEGTIPSDPNGVAAGYTGEASNFEPEEDELADADDADA